MQINPDINIGAYRIRSYGTKEINVYTPLSEEEIRANMTSPNHKPISHTITLNQPFIISADKLITDWNVADISSLCIENFATIVELKVEILLLGTGKFNHFPDPKINVYLQQRGIGIEVMNTEAACRTYNFLVADGRKVAAALFMIEE